MIEIFLLRLVHILAGTVWVGTAVFHALLLMTTLSRLGPAAAPVMAGLRERRLFVILPALALLTILSGLRLLYLT